MEQQVDQMQIVLSDLSQRDDNLYRAMLGAEPIPLSARMGASQQISYYDSLARMTNTQLAADIRRKVDILEKELYVQARSYDEIVELAKNQETRMENIPAIQPVLNKDLKHMASGYGWRIDPVLLQTTRQGRAESQTGRGHRQGRQYRQIHRTTPPL